LIHHLFPEIPPVVLSGLAAVFALVVTFIALATFRIALPKDRGRAFASQADISVGKPTGAGLMFIAAIIISALIFLPIDLFSLGLYAIIFLSMIFGFLDDRARKPWHEYFKGLLDLLISVSAAVVYVMYAGNEMYLPFSGRFFSLPLYIFIPLATLLVWASINVTNCTDGVDGLSSSLTIISLTAFIGLAYILGTINNWTYLIPVAVGALLAYLWFNTHPSLLLMGDAGSRGLGVIIALSALFSKSPLSYLMIGLVFIIDGGAGILKISLKRFLKIGILKNVKTPIHDHFRDSGKKEEDNSKKWKNQTVTVRFSLISILICSIYLLVESVCSGIL
jgi:phospho-N-acetylmuramoyl-pentapeptide-transferase